jgi:hypothetical protein
MNNQINNKITNKKKHVSIHKTKKISNKSKTLTNIKYKHNNNKNKVFTYSIGSSIIKVNKDTITIYTNTDFSYEKLHHDIDFINNFDINKINQINHETKDKWTIKTYNYTGKIFMCDISKNDGYTYPKFINNKHLTYMIIHLRNTNYLSITSYFIEEFKLPDNDKIILANDEKYSRSHNQYIFLNGNKYVYYISLPYIGDIINGKSFYMSIDNYKKYGNFNDLYNSNKAGFESKSKKWYVTDYIKIQNTLLGIIFHKSKKIKVYNIVHELEPKTSIINHNTDYN